MISYICTSIVSQTMNKNITPCVSSMALRPPRESTGIVFNAMEEEIWKPIKGYEGRYLASAFGRIKSVRRKAWNGYLWHEIPERVLRGRYNKRSYAEVTLWRDGKRQDFFVHTLICQSFNGDKPGDGFEVDHIDGNPRNNKASNLRWVSHLDNMHNPISRKRLEKACERSRRRVCQYTKDGFLVETFESITDAAIETGINLGNIGSCVAGNKKHKTAGGYRWEYANLE